MPKKKRRRRSVRNANKIKQTPPVPVVKKPSTAQIPKKVLEDIPEEVRAALEDLPEETQIAIQRAYSFSGPFPPPFLLKQYEENLPGAADRVFVFTENEQQHRHQFEGKALQVHLELQRRGQWMGLILPTSAVLGSIICAALGQGPAAITLGGMGLAGILSSIIDKFLNKDGGSPFLPVERSPDTCRRA